MTRPHLLDALRDRVLLCDGGMGSRVQALTLDVEKDYWGRENCTDVLVLSRPDLVREIHRGYFAGRRRHGGDQHLRRLAGHAGRVRPRRPRVRDQQDRRRTGARGGGDFRRRPRTAG